MRAARKGGFTLPELLVSVVLGGIVLASVYKIMINQGRAYGKERELMDVRETVRSGATLLAWELRGAATGGSQLATMTADSLTLRAIQGFGIVCAKHATLPRYALWRSGGSIAATSDDSALAYMGSNQWRRQKISQVGTPSALGVTACAWPGARVPDLVVEVTGDTSSIVVGASFRAFRTVRYAEYQTSGRWWLGRKVGAAATYDQLTGPLLAPASGGLKFAYYDTLGAVTANAAALGAVGFTLRAQSLKQLHLGPGPLQYQVDSLTTRVALRR